MICNIVLTKSFFFMDAFKKNLIDLYVIFINWYSLSEVPETLSNDSENGSINTNVMIDVLIK